MRHPLAVTVAFLGVLSAGCGTGSTGADRVTTEQSPSSAPTKVVPVVLQPNDTTAAGYVYVATATGKTRCFTNPTSVQCEAQGGSAVHGFPQAPLNDNGNGPDDHRNKAMVDAVGALSWNQEGGEDPDSLAGSSNTDYVLSSGKTYSAAGWTIRATDTGTTFTNDQTGHGMTVSIDNADVRAF